MTREIPKRLVRPATLEEKERHRRIRQQIEREMLEIREWARQVAAHQQQRVTDAERGKHE